MAASTDSFVPTKVLSTKHFFSFFSLLLLITPITEVCSERADWRNEFFFTFYNNLSKN